MIKQSNLKIKNVFIIHFFFYLYMLYKLTIKQKLLNYYVIIARMKFKYTNDVFKICKYK